MKSITGSFLITVSSLLALAGISSAAIVTYTVDPTRSSLTLASAYGGQPATEQLPGSLVDSYNGTITGDLTGGTLTLSGGSAIMAMLHTAAGAGFTPTPGSGGVDNYGGQIQAFAAFIAYRSIGFDLPSGSLINGSPFADPFVLISGHADYSAGPPVSPPTGTVAFIGATAPNASALNATITTSGSIETLTIPISISYPGTLSAAFTGQIVAFRNIPEPTSLVLGAMGLTAGLLRRRRH